MNTLLTRDKFRSLVFERDNYKCIFCDNPAKDAHHILERRLWDDGGYYLNNGASLCEEHHILCETTQISVEDIRVACGIEKPIIPSHLYDDLEYDKWGNPLLPNGMRLKGELFHDESVQKILKQGNALSLFTHWVKYPRTHHVPWSESVSKDDRVHSSMDSFANRRVIVTEKMDGENTTMYSDHIHARSLDSQNHPSRNWVKNFWSQIRMDIPSEWRICGENLFAEHSIHYDSLKSYLYGFSIWNNKNECLSWDETIEWFNLLGINPVTVMYDGIYDEELIKLLWNPKQSANHEGYVIRLADSFSYHDFRKSVGKFVRAKHIQTTKHWMMGQPIIPNQLEK